MLNFNLNLNTNVIFKPHALEQVGEELRKLNVNNVLIVTDSGIMKTGLIDKVVDLLAEEEISSNVYSGVEANPTIDNVNAGFKQYKENNLNGVLAIGGGSSIDCAKAIAILAMNGGKLADYFGAFKVNVPGAKLIAVPTTAGTGSEVSTAASIKDSETSIKHAIRSDHVIPDLAILDPVLLHTLPEKIAIETSLDAFTHLIEAYVSKGANPYTDALSIYGIELIGKYLKTFISNRANLEASSHMLFASLLGGIVISSARTGAAHTITRPLGKGISHGLANAIILPYVMEFNLTSSVEKFSKIAEVLGEKINGNSLEDAEKSILYVRDLNKTFHIPSSFREFDLNIDTEKLAKVAYEMDISRLNPRDLGVKEIESILRKVV